MLQSRRRESPWIQEGLLLLHQALRTGSLVTPEPSGFIHLCLPMAALWLVPPYSCTIAGNYRRCLWAPLTPTTAPGMSFPPFWQSPAGVKRCPPTAMLPSPWLPVPTHAPITRSNSAPTAASSFQPGLLVPSPPVFILQASQALSSNFLSR